jgi:hypothetical protein
MFLVIRTTLVWVAFPCALVPLKWKEKAATTTMLRQPLARTIAAPEAADAAALGAVDEADSIVLLVAPPLQDNGGVQATLPSGLAV